MDRDEELERLRGAVHAACAAAVLALGQVAALRGGGDPEDSKAALEQSLAVLAAATPDALAVMEASGGHSASAGYEEALEGIAALARRALVFGPLPSP
jgi:hypothetical protein